jgi:hypothetical protein
LQVWPAKNGSVGKPGEAKILLICFFFN